MASKHVEVKSYRLYFRPSPASAWGFPGGFTAPQCYGYLLLDSKTSSDVYFLAIVDNSIPTLPDPKTAATNPTAWVGTAAIRQENLPGLIDLLRNEKPIFMTLFDTVPVANTISTDAEPIGEGPDTSV
ncbi:MAG: hypothetical protein QM784_37995 [Polyangiaceae bacterium]